MTSHRSKRIGLGLVAVGLLMLGALVISTGRLTTPTARADGPATSPATSIVAKTPTPGPGAPLDCRVLPEGCTCSINHIVVPCWFAIECLAEGFCEPASSAGRSLVARLSQRPAVAYKPSGCHIDGGPAACSFVALCIQLRFCEPDPCDIDCPFGMVHPDRRRPLTMAPPDTRPAEGAALRSG